MKTTRFAASLLFLAPLLSVAQQTEKVDLNTIHRIKEEALGRNSKVMDHMFYLTDVNGPRLNNPRYGARAPHAPRRCHRAHRRARLRRHERRATRRDRHAARPPRAIRRARERRRSRRRNRRRLVLRGSARAASGGRAGPGERLLIDEDRSASPARSRGKTGPAASRRPIAPPSPRRSGSAPSARGAPGDQGAPRFPLAIQKLDVRVTIDHDFAITEVDETFFNPSSEVVEGVYRFRTPRRRDAASLRRRSRRRDRVGPRQGEGGGGGAVPGERLPRLDRGSGAPRVGRAGRLPRAPLSHRAGRDAARGGRATPSGSGARARRASGGSTSIRWRPKGREARSRTSRSSRVTRSSLAKAGAKEVRTGMTGVLEGTELVVREHGPRAARGSRGGALRRRPDDAARVHRAARGRRRRRSRTPSAPRLRAAPRPRPTTSSCRCAPATSRLAPRAGSIWRSWSTPRRRPRPATLAIARAATRRCSRTSARTIAPSCGPATRAPAGGAGAAALAAVDEAMRRAICSTGLATVDRGGATDLGAMLRRRRRASIPLGAARWSTSATGRRRSGSSGSPTLRDRLVEAPAPGAPLRPRRRRRRRHGASEGPRARRASPSGSATPTARRARRSACSRWPSDRRGSARRSISGRRSSASSRANRGDRSPTRGCSSSVASPRARCRRRRSP